MTLRMIPAWFDLDSDIPAPPVEGLTDYVCEATCEPVFNIDLKCTRRPGHTGRHAAAGGRHIVAVWPRIDVNEETRP